MEIIKDAAIPFCEKHKLSYKSEGKYIVIYVAYGEARYSVHVEELGNNTVTIFFARVLNAKKDLEDTLQTLNYLNNILPGKWVCDGHLGISYILDNARLYETTPEEFNKLFDEVLGLVDSLYEPLMKWRFAGVPVEKSLAPHMTKAEKEIDDILKQAEDHEKGDENNNTNN